MKILSFVLALLVGVSVSAAREHVDMFFSKGKGSNAENLCLVSVVRYSLANLDATGKSCSPVQGKARLRVLNPQMDESQRFGFNLVRPFLIIDGIYLGTDEARSLGDLQEEVERFGIVDPLVELGYTPILVQFTETVKTSLKENAQTLAAILRIMNSNVLFGFENKLNDGIVVLGVSQGGILGRYASYLYDSKRNKKTDAPIRLYASLDSPHQGAVMPLSLYYTINFWAEEGGSADAEAFKDMIDGPGASGLLLHQKKCEDSKCDKYTYEVDTSTKRFLFGEYRKAAEYKGFPSVLVAQGQFKGKSPTHSNTYFVLNRYAEKFGSVFGRAESMLYSYTNGVHELAKNRIYQFPGDIVAEKPNGAATYDFIQGSTYPFAETMYNGLREGMLDAMPNGMTKKIAFISVDISTDWDEDSLIQKNSTFIPTASAMDLNCNGKLAMTDNCAFTQSQSGFPFTNPGSRSSADAVYAVDATHPRYKESISGRHIELPSSKTLKSDSLIVGGLQVDMWRVLCELANYDYDDSRKGFRNENLSWYFTPGTNCMDQTKMPNFLRKDGYVQKKYFAYGRYDYKADATEQSKNVTFDVPAGWHKVAVFDYGEQLPEGSDFQVDIKVNKSNGNWVKAELLLMKSKSGAGQLQLQEIPVTVDGKNNHVHWKFPAGEGALKSYRWIRLVLNSDGGNVTVSKPVITKTVENTNKKFDTLKENLYPNIHNEFFPWTSSASATPYTDALGSGMALEYRNVNGGVYLDLEGEKSADSYTKLQVYYWPGTCQGTGIYFDSYATSMQLLSDNPKMDGRFLMKEVPISDIVNTGVTHNHRKIVSRLVFRSLGGNEKCLVYRILAK
ncbi:MAG: hypothetical protein IK114_06685 [Fibrobacter sp.]|jgi:hypothetical protein|nr:hypothetical protein [Fibrobacter sp.]